MDKFLEKILITLFAIFPVGILLVKGWVSGFLFVCSALSLCWLFIHKKDNLAPSTTTKFWLNLISLMFCAPMIAVLISQLLRRDWYPADLDSPLRFLLALPIFQALVRMRFQPLKYWQYSIGMCLVLTFIAMPWIPKYYGADMAANLARQSTYFVDPLSFGRLTLAFGFLMLFTIHLTKKDHWFEILIKLVCAFLGIYLSIQSGSRTGWLALPFVLLLLVYAYVPINKGKATGIAFALAIVVSLSLYGGSATVKDRVSSAMKDVQTYQWNAPNNETSLGERISFTRMAWYYFKLNPLAGFGHSGFKSHYDDPEISVYAIEPTRHHPAEGGLFHNELSTNMVAFGVWGIIYTTLLFLAPLGLFIASWKNKLLPPPMAAFGITYVVCELLSSLSTEVFALKFTASLYAFFIAGLCAGALNFKKI